MKKKDPDARPRRVCSPRYAVKKAKKGVELNKWELEDLANDARYALDYAKFKQCRFPEAEEAIVEALQNYETRSDGFEYFIDNGVENKKVKKLLLDRHYQAYTTEYAVKCMKKRWPAAERLFFNKKNPWRATPEDWIEYHKELVVERWPALEKACRYHKLWDDFCKYLSNFDKEKAHKILEKCNSASLLLYYAKEVMRGRLPPNLHNKMTMMTFDPKKQKVAKRYFKFIRAREMRVVGWLAQIDEDERQKLMELARKAS